MLIVADENMPLLEECFGEFGTIKKLPGRNLSNGDLKDASVLLVRSVTKVDKNLLEGTPVRFVGTATIGTDHLDMAWMNHEKIHHVSAPGCNAESVADWVVACLAHWSLRMGKNLAGLKAGIVGHGNVGSRVEARLKGIGMATLVSDPPKANRDRLFQDSPLDELTECDLISLHAPLIPEGDHPTHRLIGDAFLSNLRDGTLVMSAGRGPVLDVAAVRQHVDRLHFFLDVWDPEPNVPQDLLEKVDITTPHIAGYSLQSKWRGTEMLYREFCKFLGRDPSVIPYPLSPQIINLEPEMEDWRRAVLRHYDPLVDSNRTKETLLGNKAAGQAFDLLRKNYPLRHEFDFPVYRGENLSTSSMTRLKKIGFRVQHD